MRKSTVFKFFVSLLALSLFMVGCQSQEVVDEPAPEVEEVVEEEMAEEEEEDGRRRNGRRRNGRRGNG